MGSLPTANHQFFQEPRRSQNLKIFSPIFFAGFILFLGASTKFTMTKISETQVPLFHAYADIK